MVLVLSVPWIDNHGPSQMRLGLAVRIHGAGSHWVHLLEQLVDAVNLFAEASSVLHALSIL